jgi:hypothetical protein
MKLRVVPKTVRRLIGLPLFAIIGYFGWMFCQPLGLERGDGSLDGITILQKDSLGKAIRDYKIRERRWPKARSDIEDALAPGVRKKEWSLRMGRKSKSRVLGTESIVYLIKMRSGRTFELRVMDPGVAGKASSELEQRGPGL